MHKLMCFLFLFILLAQTSSGEDLITSDDLHNLINKESSALTQHNYEQIAHYLSNTSQELFKTKETFHAEKKAKVPEPSIFKALAHLVIASNNVSLNRMKILDRLYGTPLDLTPAPALTPLLPGTRESQAALGFLVEHMTAISNEGVPTDYKVSPRLTAFLDRSVAKTKDFQNQTLRKFSGDFYAALDEICTLNKEHPSVEVTKVHSLLYGFGCPQDISEAFRLLVKVAKGGNMDAMGFLIALKLNKTQKEKLPEEGKKLILNFTFNKDLIFLLEKAATEEIPAAQYFLARLYSTGEGVIKDLERAFKLYELSANKGNIYAMHSLCFAYTNGWGVKKDLNQAFQWCQKTASGGHRDAMSYLGFIFANGLGTLKNPMKAFEWCKQAAERGDANAMYGLGEMYAKGYGIEKSREKAREKAVEWYEKAADGGELGAMYGLGEMYAKGYGIEKSREKAVEWYEKAADKKHLASLLCLAKMYNGGIEVKQDKLRVLYYLGVAKNL